MAALSSSFYIEERINTLQALDLAGMKLCKKASSESNRLSDRSFEEERTPSEIVTPQQIEAIKKHLPPRLFSLLLPKILRGEVKVDAPHCMFLEDKPSINLSTSNAWLSVELFHYGIGPNRLTWRQGHAAGSQGLRKYIKQPLEPREITAIFARCMGFLLLERKICSQASLLKALLKSMNHSDPRLNWKRVFRDCDQFLAQSVFGPQKWIGLSPDMLRHNPYWTDLSQHSFPHD